VSRINQFNKLYFEPVGNALFFIYDDRPGVIGIIGGRLAEEGVNIEEMRNTLDPSPGRSLLMMKVDKHVPEELVRRIGSEVETSAAFSITL